MRDRFPVLDFGDQAHVDISLGKERRCVHLVRAAKADWWLKQLGGATTRGYRSNGAGELGLGHQRGGEASNTNHDFGMRQEGCQQVFSPNSKVDLQKQSADSGEYLQNAEHVR